MIYTNDEGDKSTRQKKFYLTVYILPIATAAIICGLVHLASKVNYLTPTDTLYGYIFSFMPAFLLYAFNKRNWLKMPDGTYHNIKGTSPTNNIAINEPAAYEVEYFSSTKEKVFSILIGLFLVGAGIWSIIKFTKIILVPIIITMIGGLLLSYIGIKDLLDKTAKLKLAKKGIWTKKLGFVDWNNVAKAQVIEDRSGRYPQTILEIYLKGTIFAEANKPDERLNLTNIEDKEMIEMVVGTLMSKRNE
ncbi:MAG: hypothetical protein QM727_06145 [Niabella sp.]